MTLEEAANRIHVGRSVAFFGAAFSKGATGKDGTEMAAGGGLAQRLSTAVGEPTALPLELAAQEYVRLKIEPDIRTLIEGSFTASEVTSSQQLLASLPWMRCYTTNYDNVIEFARAKAGKITVSPTALDRPVDFAGTFAVVHLHGYVGNISLDEWDNTFVLTNEQYASDLLSQSGWLETFRNDISYADSIFFFGYSMQDLDVARLMYANPSLAEKAFFIVGDAPSRPTQIRVQGYGNLIKMAVADAPKLFPQSNDPRAAKPSPHRANLIRIDHRASDARPSRDAVVNFLVKGDFRPEYAARDLVNDTREYVIARDLISDKIETFGGHPERLLIHGNLGAGKTISVFQLAHDLSLADWEVLSFSGNVDGFDIDIDYLASLSSQKHKKTLLVFENCFLYADKIKDILNRFPMLSVVLTARSAVLQTRIGTVQDAFGEDFQIVDLNELSDEESEELDGILFDNGLWGNSQGKSRKERLKYIKKNARADLPTMMVDICRSSDIFARIKNELANVESSSRELRRSLIVTLCLTLTGARLGLAQICDVVETDLFKMGRYQAHPALKEFIDFERGHVVARSATFARAVLRDIVPDILILETIPTIIARLDRLAADNEIYEETFKGLMRFGLIESIISEDQKEEKLVSFYEAIRATGVTAANPQFWLQYAIACMSFGDYKNAGDHFTTAFGLAGGRGGYDPYQIENQYARFLLESRAQVDPWKDHFDALKRAHEIVARQMNSFQEGFYPYRVARLYLPFVEANAKSFSRDQKDRIIGWAIQLLKLAENAPKNIKRSRYWREAVDALRHTKDFLTP